MPPVRVLTFCGLLFTTVQNYSRQEISVERGGGMEGMGERREGDRRRVGRRKGEWEEGMGEEERGGRERRVRWGNSEK